MAAFFMVYFLYMKEIWKEIKRCPKYSVSNKGNIRYDKTGRIRKPILSRGYHRLSYMSENRKLCFAYYHRLVAEAFIGELSEKHVDHINRVRSDNRVENLRFVTARENNNNKNPRKTKKNIRIMVIKNAIALYRDGVSEKRVISQLTARL